MAAENTPVAPPPTPMQRLWARYLKARGARIGLFLVCLFAIVALLAPFLAHRLPFFWRGADGGISFPLIREFFAPSDTTEPFLERGINFLLVFTPLALLCWRLAGRYLPDLAKRDSRLIAILFGALFASTLWLSIGGMVVQGGGSDWLHFEVAPVPETDDVLDWSLLQAAPPTATAAAARGVVEARIASAVAGPPVDAADGGPEVDAHQRRALAVIQDAVDGPALTLVDGFVAAHGLDAYGISDANLALGINTPRWNRILLETAYPGLLSPMRQFRSAFVILASVSLVALLGLTYICLAGAAQFTLSPRWLLLLGLALVVSLPFQRTPRHDHTEYRRLAEEGDGFGLFPPIPYGPNEQGFGPRLPPSWMEESFLIGDNGIRSWERLTDGLDTPDRPLGRRVSALLDERQPAWRELVMTSVGRAELLQTLNRMIAQDEIQTDEVLAATSYDIALNPYVAAIRSGKGLSAADQHRFNRLLIERAAPGAINPVAANRWKKPNHIPGYHLVGTDESGRDVLVRIIHGARVSLSVGFVSVFLATVIGLVMGSLAAYYGGKIDMLISRFVEIMMCFPSFFLILAVIAVLDRRSIINIMLVIGLTSWTGMARLIRGEMLRQKKMEYVLASVALGASDTRTIFRHILPNAMAPVLVSISFGITGAILTEAGLSFIGFGVTPPTPTWGQLLSETRDSPLANWWLAVFPGIVLFVSVVAYNLVGEALRDALDPRTTL